MQFKKNLFKLDHFEKNDYFIQCVVKSNKVIINIFFYIYIFL